MHFDLQYFIYLVENLIQTKTSLKSAKKKVPSMMFKMNLDKTF